MSYGVRMQPAVVAGLGKRLTRVDDYDSVDARALRQGSRIASAGGRCRAVVRTDRWRVAALRARSAGVSVRRGGRRIVWAVHTRVLVAELVVNDLLGGYRSVFLATCFENTANPYRMRTPHWPTRLVPGLPASVLVIACVVACSHDSSSTGVKPTTGVACKPATGSSTITLNPTQSTTVDCSQGGTLFELAGGWRELPARPGARDRRRADQIDRVHARSPNAATSQVVASAPLFDRASFVAPPHRTHDRYPARPASTGVRCAPARGRPPTGPPRAHLAATPIPEFRRTGER
jgi:hypothetical protein